MSPPLNTKILHLWLLLIIVQVSLTQVVVCLEGGEEEPSGVIELLYQTPEDYMALNDQQPEEARRKLDSEELQIGEQQNNLRGAIRSREHLKRYRLKGLNMQGFASPKEQRQIITLKELLDTLEFSPIYRSGRNSVLSIAKSNDVPFVRNSDLQVDANVKQIKNEPEQSKGFKIFRSTVKGPISGIHWQPFTNKHLTKSNNEENVRAHSISVIDNPKRDPTSNDNTVRSNNEFGWKRVETNRWNNLRGMWGR